MPLAPVLRSILNSPLAPAIGEGVGVLSFASILALNPEIAFSAAQPGAAFQERTGVSATTSSADGDPVGSLKNYGTKGGFVTAPSDPVRPIMRASGVLRYLEGDGTSSVMSGALAALRGVAGWTLVAGVRNTGSTASARNVLFITSGAGNTRAGLFFSTTSGVASIAGRRSSADTAATALGLAHASTDIVLTGVGDYTNTDAFVRSDGLQEGSNTSWLTAGASDSDAGDVQIFAGIGPGGYLAGRLYSLLVFGSVLGANDLRLAERWTAAQMGSTVFF